MMILITGAAGKIGSRLSNYLIEKNHSVISVDIVYRNGINCVDLANKAAVFKLVKNYSPDLIIHLAAIKNLNFCEHNEKEARVINYGITEILTQICSELKIRMIYFSSDYVFGKYDHSWIESDVPCPTTKYGIDKAASEHLIQKELTDFAIIRTAQLYGFPGDFISLACESIITHGKFEAYSNLVNCPTWIEDLFSMIIKIINKRLKGIFHCVGPEALSRFHFSIGIAKSFAFSTSCIHPIEIDFSEDIRPSIVRLDGSNTYKVLQVYPKKLNEALSSLVINSPYQFYEKK